MALENDKTGRDPEYHGTKGVWVMDDVKYQNPLSKRFLEVGQAAGLGFNEDFNSWKKPQDGVGRFQVSEYNGERVSGATAFLDQARRRKNLTVRTGCMVRKINFDGSKTARGVTYDIIGDDSATVSIPSFNFVLDLNSLNTNISTILNLDFPSQIESRWRSYSFRWSTFFSSDVNVQWSWTWETFTSSWNSSCSRQPLRWRELARSSRGRGIIQITS